MTRPPVREGDLLLGKYRVERVLGQGGMGIVVAARHLDLGALFAIKLMLPEAMRSEGAVKRFLREARAAVQLKGEHAAHVHDVGRLPDGAPYMIMEHLTGSDLSAVLLEHGPLDVREVVTYCAQAATAIAEAHALGIVHRDLKPANLFLTWRADGTPCVKVLDFGIARTLVPEDGLDMTRTTAIVGSPLYMSPEQMQSSKRADLRSDVWSLGIVLFQLATGVVPFQGETITELFAHVLQQPAPRPSSLRPELPPALDAIVLRCLEKDPAARYANAGELLEALRGLEGALALAKTQVLPAPGRLVASDATVTPPGLLGGGASWAEGTPPPAPKARRAGVLAGLALLFIAGVSAGRWLSRTGPPPPPEVASGAGSDGPLGERLQATSQPAGAALQVPLVSPAPSASGAGPPTRSSVSPPVTGRPLARPSGLRAAHPPARPTAKATPTYEGVF